MKNLQSHTLGTIVSNNYKASLIFEKYGIDFCCKGHRTLWQACQEAGLFAADIELEISKSLLTIPATDDDYNQWPLDRLIDRIISKHHHYIEEVTPMIKSLLDKIVQVHGDHHPELIEIREVFFVTSGELAVHMKKEEFILFPYIRKLLEQQQTGHVFTSPIFGTVLQPIEQMNADHLEEGKQLDRIRMLSNQFTPPEDACMSYLSAYRLLKEYTTDIHLHIHLENNILFPKSILLEHSLSQ